MTPAGATALRLARGFIQARRDRIVHGLAIRAEFSRYEHLNIENIDRPLTDEIDRILAAIDAALIDAPAPRDSTAAPSATSCQTCGRALDLSDLIAEILHLQLSDDKNDAENKPPRPAQIAMQAREDEISRLIKAGRAVHAARAASRADAGLTRCPNCGNRLRWSHDRRGFSAECATPDCARFP